MKETFKSFVQTLLFLILSYVIAGILSTLFLFLLMIIGLGDLLSYNNVFYIGIVLSIFKG